MRYTSIYREKGSNYQSDYTGGTAVNNFRTFCREKEVRWARLFAERDGQLIASYDAKTGFKLHATTVLDDDYEEEIFVPFCYLNGSPGQIFDCHGRLTKFQAKYLLAISKRDDFLQFLLENNLFTAQEKNRIVVSSNDGDNIFVSYLTRHNQLITVTLGPNMFLKEERRQASEPRSLGAKALESIPIGL